ncbi:hypothetical protein [Halobellus rubicundus]|uniref:Uncharacterized protein n=1 Tax=Halobellus rubicundus TaxID=2996466 RepID=A0ABD5MDG3_9EURY
MSDTSFTLFEIHLHDGLTFSANAEATNTAPAIGGLFGSSSEGDESDDESDDSGAGRGGCVSKRLLLVVFIALVALVIELLAARSRGDGERTKLTDFTTGSGDDANDADGAA